MKITRSQLKQVIKEELEEVRAYSKTRDVAGGAAMAAGGTIGFLLSIPLGPGAVVGAGLGAMAGKAAASKLGGVESDAVGGLAGKVLGSSEQEVMAKLARSPITEKSLIAALEMLEGKVPNFPHWVTQQIIANAPTLSPQERKMLRFDEETLRLAGSKLKPETLQGLIDALKKAEILDPSTGLKGIGTQIRKWAPKSMGGEGRGTMSAIRGYGDPTKIASEGATKLGKAQLIEIINEEIANAIAEKKKDKVDPYERPLEAALEEEEEDKWTQKVTKSIEKRGTEGVCTGDKFGGPTCKPGTKRYNLAKTFRKMAKDRKK